MIRSPLVAALEICTSGPSRRMGNHQALTPSLAPFGKPLTCENTRVLPWRHLFRAARKAREARGTRTRASCRCCSTARRILRARASKSTTRPPAASCRCPGAESASPRVESIGDRGLIRSGLKRRGFARPGPGTCFSFVWLRLTLFGFRKALFSCVGGVNLATWV